ncbi:MAG: gliding motility-associated C-terminal domain-containing protein [Bacteroidetes bacterium]|nr:gliding motility-associated C-terminal domain-containing protein [Bacteroidota bacterium]
MPERIILQMPLLKRVLTFFLCVSVAIIANAQNLAQHNWYFGNSSSAILFNRSTNKASTIANKAALGTGGSAVATDPDTGDLLFYTDGSTLYDITNTAMPLGTGLLANTSANQPVVICPMPGDSTKFFVFANTANYTTGGTITMSVVDMTSFGNATTIIGAPPFGDILLGGPTSTVPQLNLATGLTGRSEGMIVVPNANQRDFWLVTHQNGSTTYTASLITPGSYNRTTSTFAFSKTQTSGGIALPTSVANFSIDKKNTRLAVSAQDPNTDAIILRMDTTGMLAFDRTIYNSGKATTQPQSIYDMQWDNKGQYLYLSRVGETGINADVLQYDYMGSTGTTVILSSVLQNPIYRSWGLQLAPDSAIYHIYQALTGGPFLVEKFTKTDTVASSVIQTALPLGALDFNGTQFPSFVPKINIKLSISFAASGVCQNSNITFFPTVLPNADSLRWDLGDTTITAWSPIHKYKNAGTYNVKLTAYYQGKADSVVQSITINPFTLTLQLVSDTTACHCQLPVNKTACTMPLFSVTAKTNGATGSTTFLWSDGITTTAKFSPDSAGYYYVVAKDGSGCSTYAGVNIKEYGKTDQRSNVWYFGNKAGINFTTRKALSNSAMDAPAGCAIACDRNGQAIIYTDGYNLYDKKDVLIATGIGGNPNSSQSSMIVPVPGDETLYYIFTTNTIAYSGATSNELRYSLYDLKKDSLLKKNILLFSKSTERVTASADWLVAHEYGTNTFRAYRITPGGLGNPVYSSIGSVHSFQYKENGQGYMKLGPKNNLAVALSTPAPAASNVVELFHLNDTTGVITNYRKIDLGQPAGQVYGIEFSPGGNKLFASIIGTPTSNIFEYSIDSLGRTSLLINNVMNAMVGALQIAPDNQIYFAINNSPANAQLGVISAVDTPLTATSPVSLTGFALAAGTNSNLGLPNFRQQVGSGFGGPGFTVAGLCLGDSTAFVGTTTDPIDKFTWNFGDGSSNTKDLAPKHLYASAGTYTVTFHLTNRCGLDTTIAHTIKISASPPTPSLPAVTFICSGQVTLHANTPANPPSALYKYLWSTSDTTESIVVSKRSIISVTNTDLATGCTATATSIVNDNRPKVTLGSDQTLCQNSVVANLDAQNPGDTFSWSITDVNAGTTSPGGTIQFQAVDTSTPGIFLYKVSVTDPSTTCTTSAQQQFTIIASPTFTMTALNPTACNSTDGKVTLSSITSPNLYSYSITGPSFNQQDIDQTAATQVTPATLGQGTYTAMVTDQVSGCYTFNTIGLSAGTFTITPSVADPCDAPSMKVSNNIPAAGFPINYTITGSNTTTVTGTINAQAASFNVQLLPQGANTSVTYTVQVADASGCIVAPNFTLTTSNPTPLSIVSNLCSNPATLQASGGSNYVWTSTSFPGNVSGSTLNITSSGTYKVTGKSGACTVADSISVIYNGPFVPNFVQSDTCSAQVILNATPVGNNFTYRWYQNITPPVPPAVVPPPTQLGQQVVITPTDDGSTFTLVVVDAQSGCSLASAPKKVSVVGQVTAALTSTLACDDGKPFTLTATTNVTGATYQWLLNGTTIATAASDTLHNKSEGTYEVDITYQTCKASASIDIVKAPIPIGLLRSAYKICDDPDNHIDSTRVATLFPGFFAAYDWFKNGIRLDSTTSKIIASSSGEYSVMLTNAVGCTNLDKTEVIDDCEPIVTGPNAFKPGSAVVENKNFKLFTFFITDNFEVLIFDRWGEMIFESKDRNFNWNGGYKNNLSQPLPGGTYVYLVRYVSSYHQDQGVLEQRGGVVLLR